MNIKVIELLNGGDWACVYSEPESLVRACQGLAVLIEEELATYALEVADWADRDMRTAVRRWGELAMRVRYPSGRRVRLAHGSGSFDLPDLE